MGLWCWVKGTLSLEVLIGRKEGKALLMVWFDVAEGMCCNIWLNLMQTRCGSEVPELVSRSHGRAA